MSTEENLVHFGWYKDFASQICSHFSCVLVACVRPVFQIQITIAECL